MVNVFICTVCPWTNCFIKNNTSPFPETLLHALECPVGLTSNWQYVKEWMPGRILPLTVNEIGPLDVEVIATQEQVRKERAAQDERDVEALVNWT